MNPIMIHTYFWYWPFDCSS